jgi:hypothetical protein
MTWYFEDGDWIEHQDQDYCVCGHLAHARRRLPEQVR